MTQIADQKLTRKQTKIADEKSANHSDNVEHEKNKYKLMHHQIEKMRFNQVCFSYLFFDPKKN